jgi:uncharacterized membrane protein
VRHQPAFPARPGRPIDIVEELPMTRTALTASLLAAIAAPALFAVPAAAGPAAEPAFQAEKCYGIARAGQNDCASTGNNSCAGTSRADADPNAWVYVPAGYCERIVGGSLTAGA